MKKIALTLAILLCGNLAYAAVTDISLEPLLNKVYDSATSTIKVSNSAIGMTLVRKETSQALGSGSLAYTSDFAAKTRIKEILFHAASAITQTVTIKFNSKTGSNYDVTLDSVALVSEQDVAYTPVKELILESGDEIDITCTNSGTPAITVYCTVVGETLS